MERIFQAARDTTPEELQNIVDLTLYAKKRLKEMGESDPSLISLMAGSTVLYYGKGLAPEIPDEDPEDEKKERICKLLAGTLKATRNGHDIADILYEKDDKEETATVVFNSGYKKKINVTGDSGTAMIYDIIIKL